MDQILHMAASARGHQWYFLFLNPPSFLSGPFEGRASIDGATVTLRQVTQEDAGDYRCEISASMDSVVLGEANVTLKVLGTADKMSLWLEENGLVFFIPLN